MNIDEIAKKAKVSRSTVSRVINNYPTVKENTRLAVQKVIEELNYIPSAAARTLASKKTNVIGVLIYNITQPFWSGIFAGIEQYISKTEYGLFLVNSKNHLDVWDYKNDYRKNLRNLVQRGVDGIIVALANDLKSEDLDFLETSDIPFVVIQNHLNNERVTGINVDNIAGAREATEYLIRLGHRNIVHMAGPLDSGISRDRVEGFMNAMQDAGLSLTGDSIVNCGFLFNDGYWCMKRLMAKEDAPTAVLCANDITAFGAYLAVQEEDGRTPEDISIIGFDRLSKLMDVSGLLPDLTTMEQPVGEIGAAAAQLLLQKLEGGDGVKGLTFSLSLHPGATTHPPRDFKTK